MIETIVLIQNGKYPFGQTFSTRKTVKVEDIRSYSSLDELKQQKLKMQSLFYSSDKGSQTTVTSSQNMNFIKLIKIYQQDLRLHFIYEYVPYSINQYIQNKLYGQIDMQKSHIIQMNSKLFLKKVYYELGSILNFLINKKIKLNLEYELLGIDNQQNLKLFIDPNCQVLTTENKKKQESQQSFTSKQIQNELRHFYQWKKQQIISKLDIQFRKMKKRQQYVPNFVIKGNQLIFCKTPSQVSSECYSPCPSNFTQSSFTDRCQSVDNNFDQPQDQNIRKTHGNLFTKLKKTESYNYNTESNKKLQQNLIKLENLKKKSKKLNQQLKQSYLSNNRFPPPRLQKDQNEFNNRHSSTQSSHFFNKRFPTQNQQEAWRNSQIPGNLRKTHLPNGSTPKSPTRFGNFDGKRSKSNRNHKSSFQFKPSNQKDRQWFNPNKSFDKGQQQEFQDKSFQQTKSIRIQLEQTTKNKERKNSYKVKILTCQEMEMDGDNIQEFVFNAMNKNFQGKGEENDQNEPDQNDLSNQSEYGKQSNRSKSSKYSNRFQNIFSQKFKDSQRNDDFNSKFSQSPIKHHVRQRQSSSQKNIFQKYQEQFGNENQKSSRNQKLDQKIKLAKQKAENILNKYMKNKKYSNKTSNSKYGS